MVRYSLDVDINQEVSSFNVENKMNDYIKVQKSILPILEKENYFGEVVNDEIGMIIDIGKKGIKETLGSGKRFQYLPRELKVLKIATLRSLPQMIKVAQVMEDNVINIHGNDSNYMYLQVETDINGIPFNVTIDIKKSSKKNKFWMHNIRIEKENSQLLSPGQSQDVHETRNSSKTSLS